MVEVSKGCVYIGLHEECISRILKEESWISGEA